jgi:hypothetical protein
MTKRTTLAAFLFVTASGIALATPAPPAPAKTPAPENPESILTAEELQSCRSTRAGCWGVSRHKVRVAKQLAAKVAEAFLLPAPPVEEEKS